MARWHVWLTFVFTMAASAIWMYQGLLGGPRRFNVLPHRYDAATQLAVPISLLIGAAQLLFAWNIIQTVRGKGIGRVEHTRLGSMRAITIGLAVLAAASVGGWAAYRAQASTTPAVVDRTREGIAPEFLAGRLLFTNAGCAACHTLAAAHATGTVGPNLDALRPNETIVITNVTNGGKAMPPFKSRLTAEQIKDVAVYVSQAAGSG